MPYAPQRFALLLVTPGIKFYFVHLSFIIMFNTMSVFVGGYKGSGLAMMVEILCGILSGANYAQNIRTWDTHSGSYANLVFSPTNRVRMLVVRHLL